jgi:glycosyltransferase involved in cell wall biosynthesis
MPERETWLILSHAFNMDGRAASQTVTDKIPYLIAHGVTPIVVSAVTGERDRNVEHHRLLAVLPAGLRFDLRHVLRRSITNKAACKIATALTTLVLLPFYLLERAFIPLEPQWSWFIPAYFRGARLIRERGCSVIYSTGGASSAHLAGYLLAKKFALPWIAEIHDPMVSRDSKRTGMRSRFAAWLEAKICTRADVPIWFVENALAHAKQRNPALGDRGKAMIPGADRPSFGKIAYKRGAELTIGHFGSLASSRNLAVFLEALARILRKRPKLAKIVRLELYGSAVDPVSADAIAQFPFPGIVRPFGRLERDPVTGVSGRDRVLKRMQTVDALLLLHGTGTASEEYIPSKVYEYFWSERPIIGLLGRNPQLDRILREAGHWAVLANDVAAVAAMLEELIARWQADDLRDSGEPSPYTSAAAVDQIIGWLADARRARQAQMDAIRRGAPNAM